LNAFRLGIWGHGAASGAIPFQQMTNPQQDGRYNPTFYILFQPANIHTSNKVGASEKQIKTIQPSNKNLSPSAFLPFLVTGRNFIWLATSFV
jgi:hypothetical protein